MGCLSRVGCLVVVVAAGAVGYWLYGDRLPSELTRVAGKAAGKVRDAADHATRGAGQPDGNPVATNDSARDASRSTDRSIAWATVTPGTEAPPAVLAALKRKDGPAFVSLGAGDLAALAGSGLRKQLPASVSDLQVALEGNQLLARAVVDVSELAGDGTLGSLLGTALSGRDTVRLAGTVEPLRTGVAQVHIVGLRLKGIDVPPPFIPTFLKTLRRGPRVEGLAADALMLPLPTSVADVRVANGKLTLYKAIPNP